MANIKPEKLLKADEVAEIFGEDCNEGQVYYMARRGLLPCVKIGRKVRFSPSQLSDFINNGGQAYKGQLA